MADDAVLLKLNRPAVTQSDCLLHRQPSPRVGATHLPSGKHVPDTCAVLWALGLTVTGEQSSRAPSPPGGRPLSDQSTCTCDVCRGECALCMGAHVLCVCTCGVCAHGVGVHVVCVHVVHVHVVRVHTLHVCMCHVGVHLYCVHIIVYVCIVCCL